MERWSITATSCQPDTLATARSVASSCGTAIVWHRRRVARPSCGITPPCGITAAARCLVALALPSSFDAPLRPLPPQPDRVPWPTRQWPLGDLPAEVDLDGLMDEAFDPEGLLRQAYA